MPYKISYSKNYSLLSGSSWSCFIHDRQRDQNYIGRGNTKKEAKEDAWDTYYAEKSRVNSSYSNSTSDSKPRKGNYFLDEILPTMSAMILLPIAGLILGYLVGAFIGLCNAILYTSDFSNVGYFGKNTAFVAAGIGFLSGLIMVIGTIVRRR